MPVYPCICGTRLEAADEAGLRAAIDSHLAQQHPGFSVTPQQYEDALAYALGAVMPERPATQPQTVIRRLEPALLDDFLHFFDRVAFADNPSWSNCYCNCYQFTGSGPEWNTSTARGNREAQIARIQAGASPGYLAYVDGAVGGWCRAGARSLLPNFDRGGVFPVDDPATAAAVVCFTIAAPYRRFGLARQLLEYACVDLASQGLQFIEAFPLNKAQTSDPAAYHGPRALFEAAGFQQVGETKDFLRMRKRF